MWPQAYRELKQVTCHFELQGKGPGEEWSYGSKKGRDEEKAKERDSMDCSAPVLACYPPGTTPQTSLCLLGGKCWVAQLKPHRCCALNKHSSWPFQACLHVWECASHLWVYGWLYLFVQWAGRSWLSCTLRGNGCKGFWEIIFIFMVTDQRNIKRDRLTRLTWRLLWRKCHF